MAERLHLGLSDSQLQAANWALTSPRSIEGCKQAGVDPTQLIEPQLSDFTHGNSEMAQLHWTHAKQRVMRERKLVRKYWEREVTKSTASRPKRNTLPKSVQRLTDQADRLRETHSRIALANTARALKEDPSYVAHQEAVESRSFNHFAREVQGPLVLHKKQCLLAKTKGELHTPQGHVLRSLKERELEELRAQERRIQADALFAMESQNAEKKAQLLQARKDLVEEYSQLRDGKLQKMQDTYHRQNIEMEREKERELRRREKLCEAASESKEMLRQAQCFHTRDLHERAKSRVDSGRVNVLKKREQQRFRVMRKHRLMDLKGEQRELVDLNLQRNRQIQAREHELKVQARVQSLQWRRKDRADGLLRKMQGDEDRVRQLGRDQQARAQLHAEQNRLLALERKQRKEQIERWEQIQAEDQREEMLRKAERSDQIVKTKEKLAQQLVREQHQRIMERDQLQTELLLRQTTGSWATSAHKLFEPSHFSATAPLPRVAHDQPRILETVSPDAHLDMHVTATATPLMIDFGADLEAERTVKDILERNAGFFDNDSGSDIDDIQSALDALEARGQGEATSAPKQEVDPEPEFQDGLEPVLSGPEIAHSGQEAEPEHSHIAAGDSAS